MRNAIRSAFRSGFRGAFRVGGLPPLPTPTLLFDFAIDKVLDSRVTFTRASTATYFDASGVLHSASVDASRFDHAPATGDSLGLLIEESRTNEALHSADFSNAAWVISGAGTKAKDATGLDGVANSASSFTSGTASETLLQTVTKASATDTYSAYVRRKTGTGGVEITIDGGTTWVGITSSLTADYIRFDVTQTVTNPQFGFRLTASGDSIEVDGNQMEADAFPTSYIPTTTAQVTRAADAAAMTGTNFSDWYNPAEGGLYVEADCTNPVLASDIITVAGISNANTLLISQDVSTIKVRVRSDGVDQAILSLGDSSDVFDKIATSYKVDDFTGVLNGASAVTDTSGDLPIASQEMHFGADGAPFYGPNRQIWFKQFAYYPKALTDTELVELTK